MRARQLTASGSQGAPGGAARFTRPRGRVRRAFTLLEAALATVIIGVGVLALIQAQATFVTTNEWSTQNATATYLCNELRERIRSMPRHDPVSGLYFDASNVIRGWGPESNETTPADFDDCDDFDGASFGAGGTFPGPVDAQCRLIPRIGLNGQPVVNAEGGSLPLEGWTQTVAVSKVDPFNFATVRASSYVRAASGSTPALAVDRFPLRITVTAWFQGPHDPSRREMARVTWIQP